MATRTETQPRDIRNIFRRIDDEKTLKLCQRLASGNEAERDLAWSLLFSYFYDPGVRYSAAITGDAVEAEVIFNTAFGRMVRHYRPDIQFALYLGTIIRKLSLSYFRTIDHKVVSISQSEKALEAYEAAAYQPSTENVLIVRDALSKLDVGDREILRMYFDEGLTIEAIADELVVSKTIAHKRKTRALQRMRDLLGK